MDQSPAHATSTINGDRLQPRPTSRGTWSGLPCVQQFVPETLGDRPESLTSGLQVLDRAKEGSKKLAKTT